MWEKIFKKIDMALVKEIIVTISKTFAKKYIVKKSRFYSFN